MRHLNAIFLVPLAILRIGRLVTSVGDAFRCIEVTYGLTAGEDFKLRIFCSIAGSDVA